MTRLPLVLGACAALGLGAAPVRGQERPHVYLIRFTFVDPPTKLDETRFARDLATALSEAHGKVDASLRELYRSRLRFRAAPAGAAPCSADEKCEPVEITQQAVASEEHPKVELRLTAKSANAHAPFEIDPIASCDGKSTADLWRRCGTTHGTSLIARRLATHFAQVHAKAERTIVGGDAARKPPVVRR